MLIDFHIKHPSAAIAHKVRVGLHAAVVANVAAVDGERHCRILFAKQLKCVIYCGTRKRGEGGQQVGVDSVHSGMSAMLHEILHDSDALHRGMHAMVHELLFCSVHE